MAKFSRFKDAEYGTLFTLLDSYIPLVLWIHSISFKLNNFSEYFRAMIRIWIMFSCLPHQNSFSFSHNQLRLLKVRCAQALSSMFIKISQSPRQSQFPSNNSCNTSVPTHVILPTMSPNKNMKMTVLPLGYRCDIKPDQTKKCDLPLSNISSQDENWTLLHGCLHSFIPWCLSRWINFITSHRVRSF